MKRIARLVLLAAVAAATPLWAADVNDVKARQRWPWNGLVDIACTVSGIDGTDYVPDFFVFDPLGAGVATDRTVPPADTTEKSGGAESSFRRASATSFAAAPAPASAQTERGIVFAAQPEDRTVEAGESVTFSVEARNYLGFTASLPSGVGLEMVWCPPGTFEMGSPDGELGRDAKETRHTVVLTQGFWIGRYEVTQPQYQAVMGMNPSSFKGDDRPVDSVSFRDALNFSERLTANEMSVGRLPKGYLYTLPTEAQWEYACRAGTTTALNSGKDLSSAASCDEMGDVGWYEDNAGNATHAVGQKPSNAWGLHDMHGNVSEWCWDFYKADYPSGTVTNPPGPWSRVDGAGNCVFRGGSWHTSAQSCRSAARGHDFASHGGSQCGFRLALARNRSVTVPLAANAEMEMVWIGAGTFTMGSPTGELGRQDDETQHKVTLTRDFWLGMFEVTQKQYETVMGAMPDAFDGSKHGRDDDMPVYFVSRDEALAFCAALTDRERAAGRLPAGYRFALPTEAQWEYACRAGTTKALNNDHNLTSTTSCSSIDQVGWYKYNSGLQVHPTHGAREPNNPHYLVFLPYYCQYDMHGNVREWVADRYGAYPSGAVTDPTGQETGDVFILRGGGFDDEAWMCRSAMRIQSDGSAEDASGFRVAIVSVEGAAANPDELYPVEEPELLTGGMSYQWYKDGAAIAGATGASLTIAAATAADAGRYTVDVWCQNVTNRAAAVLAVTLPPVPYLDPVNHTTNTCETYTLYTDQTTLTSGWWVVSGDITNDTRIAVDGDVHLILADGASLTANKGVNVDVDGTITNSLTIWAQSDGKGMGRLTVPSPPNCCAGIGGDRSQGDGRHAGNLVINGGRITAQGGNFAAGIGGGHYYGFFGDDELPGNGGGVTVNGGTVTAAGGSGGAGIGGGELGNGGTVTISGGAVTAQGGVGAVGIGGGFYGSGGTVTIKPSAGTAVAVAVGEDAGSAAPVDGSPFMAETDVTGRVEGKKFVRTWEPQFHAVTVVGGSTTNSPAPEGSVVTVAADEPESGHAFVQWASNDGVDFANASAAETTFTMPAKNVTVTAVSSEILIKDLNDAGYPWTGRPVEPEIKVELKDVDIALRRGKDYEVSYISNLDSGTATLTVTMLPPGLGSRSAMFKILPKPTVSNVRATASDPWDGTVTLTFATGGNWSGLPDWNKPNLFITATDNVTGSNYVSSASALTFDTSVAEPNHRVTWDLRAQGIDFSSQNVTFTVAYRNMPDWCIIDLSGGTGNGEGGTGGPGAAPAAQYPVSYLDAVADPVATFNTDAYKTTNLVMRLIGPEADGAQPFYCAVFETTQKQWELVAHDNPSCFKYNADSPMHPVEYVSWNMIRGDASTYDWPNVKDVDSRTFLGVLRLKTGLATLDLPTGAQWEYACRAGTTTTYSYGDDANGDYMWYNDNSSSTTHVVGTKRPNAWGLYDMHGNVAEGCLERYPSTESTRLIRGGAYTALANQCATTFLYQCDPSIRYSDFGFRLVRTLAEGEALEGVVCEAASEPISIIPTYPLWVGGVQVCATNMTDILGDGTTRFNGTMSGGTLSLSNATITGTCDAGNNVTANIYAGSGFNLTLSLSGTNRVENATDGGYGIYVEGSLVTRGSGGLVSEAGQVAVSAGSRLLVADATVSAKDGVKTLQVGGRVVTAGGKGAVFVKIDVGGVTNVFTDVEGYWSAFIDATDLSIGATPKLVCDESTSNTCLADDEDGVAVIDNAVNAFNNESGGNDYINVVDIPARVGGGTVNGAYVERIRVFAEDVTEDLDNGLQANYVKITTNRTVLVRQYGLPVKCTTSDETFDASPGVHAFDSVGVRVPALEDVMDSIPGEIDFTVADGSALVAYPGTTDPDVVAAEGRKMLFVFADPGSDEYRAILTHLQSCLPDFVDDYVLYLVDPSADPYHLSDGRTALGVFDPATFDSSASDIWTLDNGCLSSFDASNGLTDEDIQKVLDVGSYRYGQLHDNIKVFVRADNCNLVNGMRAPGLGPDESSYQSNIASIWGEGFPDDAEGFRADAKDWLGNDIVGLGVFTNAFVDGQGVTFKAPPAVTNNNVVWVPVGWRLTDLDEEEKLLYMYDLWKNGSEEDWDLELEGLLPKPEKFDPSYIGLLWIENDSSDPGSTTEAYILTARDDNLALTWLWEPREVYIGVEAENGSVTPAGDWYDFSTNEADRVGYAASTDLRRAVFAGWLGASDDVDASSLAIQVLPNRPYALVAQFFEPPLAALSASLGWKYMQATGTYFAQLKLTCTNGLEAGISDLRFLFADRVGADGKTAAALWRTPLRAANPDTTAYGGAEYRYVELDESRIAAENTPVAYGVADLAAATIPVAERTIEMYVRRGVSPEDGNVGAAQVEDFVGYVVWTSDGEACAVPVVAGGAQAASLSGLSWRPRAGAALPSPKLLNASLAVGVMLADDSCPYCRIAAFSVEGGVAKGRVEVGATGGAGEVLPGSLGANATVTVLGSASPSGPFAEVATVDAAADGSFSLPVPDGVRFFRLRIDVAEAVR